ncbi:MAG: helix-turn-helix transcriptional regulator [Chloroflexi bacterium]|nr:MAG: helix-turn-helix transcriptional regulator [Chloroflexota bacterium]
MDLFQRIVFTIRGWFKRKQTGNLTLDFKTLRSLEVLAEQEKRTPEEIADHLLGEAFRSHRAQGESWQRWLNLTPREQEIAALICLNYTSRQIATRLHISQETVKTHVEHILMKFDIPDRNMLRVILNGWDFKGWDGSQTGE